MNVAITSGQSGVMTVKVRGDFDFHAARHLLIGVRRQWSRDLNELYICLDGVVRANSCAIGAVALLADMAGDMFHMRINRCSCEVESLFTSDLLDRHFPVGVLDECRLHIGQSRAMPMN